MTDKRYYEKQLEGLKFDEFPVSVKFWSGGEVTHTLDLNKVSIDIIIAFLRKLKKGLKNE